MSPWSRATSGAQLAPQFEAPCTNTTGGPLPTSCTRTSHPVRRNDRFRSVGSTPTDDQRVRSAARNAAAFTTLPRRPAADYPRRLAKYFL